MITDTGVVDVDAAKILSARLSRLLSKNSRTNSLPELLVPQLSESI